MFIVTDALFVLSLRLTTIMYEGGKGDLQDNIMAHMWYNVGAANGSELGGTNRDQIAKQMTPADISKAQALAREFINSGYTKCGY